MEPFYRLDDITRTPNKELAALLFLKVLIVIRYCGLSVREAADRILNQMTQTLNDAKRKKENIEHLNVMRPLILRENKDHASNQHFNQVQDSLFSLQIIFGRLAPLV